MKKMKLNRGLRIFKKKKGIFWENEKRKKKMQEKFYSLDRFPMGVAAESYSLCLTVPVKGEEFGS